MTCSGWRTSRPRCGGSDPRRAGASGRDLRRRRRRGRLDPGVGPHRDGALRARRDRDDDRRVARSPVSARQQVGARWAQPAPPGEGDRTPRPDRRLRLAVRDGRDGGARGRLPLGDRRADHRGRRDVGSDLRHLDGSGADPGSIRGAARADHRPHRAGDLQRDGACWSDCPRRRAGGPPSGGDARCRRAPPTEIFGAVAEEVRPAWSRTTPSWRASTLPTW